ncbi:adenylate/guanylate cyclase catalytic domain protein [Leptospira ryugenii]|uniref:Adenylate/guanylate cyclase catalytic domain protein n=1 Tax=Leptospira ryugenii TaxID=1917863 RepID=A0A2P2E3K3_9LEPT|nr:adenylate/guanylate cyclase domain-containing protein [Leptospira ryugenii]GBF51472.1 adenylate/guanylate cyclase catalytic domain protein [Leptospira ryugenii]
MFSKTELLLKEKEIQGISLSLLGKMFVASLLLVVTFFVANSLNEILWVTLMSLLFITFLFLMLRLLKKKKSVMFIGLISVVIDIAVVTALPFVWYDSVGGDAVPRTYIVKTYIHNILFGILLLHAFTLHPIYPLLYVFGVVIGQSGILLYAQNDPRFLTTDSFLEAMLGNAVHLGTYLMSMGVVAIFGFVVAFLAYIVRNTLYSAVGNEIKFNQLSRYFSPNVVGEISTADDAFFVPGGKEQTVAILFCDIEGFTNLSESLGPNGTIQFLTEFHSIMLDEIFRFNGTLDKFIGDGMLVTFGTPIASEYDAKNALLAGIAMMKRLQVWNEERKKSQLNPINIRIGIHYGPAIVGNVGAEKRLEYTVIGDTVNVASRIESIGKEIKKNFLVSKELISNIQGLETLEANLKSLGSYTFRGKLASTELFFVDVNR